MSSEALDEPLSAFSDAGGSETRESGLELFLDMPPSPLQLSPREAPYM